MKYPRKRHLRQLLSSAQRNFIQSIKTLQHYIIKLSLKPRCAAFSKTRIFGNAVEILICKKALIKRWEYGKAEVVVEAVFIEIVTFHPAIEHWIWRLIYYERCSQLFEYFLNFCGLLSVVIWNSDVESLALSYRIVKRKRSFFKRCVGIKNVMIVDVNIIELQASEALVERGCKVFSWAVLVAVRSVPHFIARLCGNAKLVTVFPHTTVENLAEVFFRTSVIGMSVIVGYIKMSNAEIECGMHHLLGSRKIRAEAEILP